MSPDDLSDNDIREGIELLFYAYRDFISDPDEMLKEYGFGRAHHRVVHFVGRNPGMTVSELLTICASPSKASAEFSSSSLIRVSSCKGAASRIVGKDCSA